MTANDLRRVMTRNGRALLLLTYAHAWFFGLLALARDARVVHAFFQIVPRSLWKDGLGLMKNAQSLLQQIAKHLHLPVTKKTSKQQLCELIQEHELCPPTPPAVTRPQPPPDSDEDVWLLFLPLVLLERSHTANTFLLLGQAH